ncbi:hypothetical protein M431DRAFT_516340 [Trichoderma harzianum CBS 226.95]|uniref:Uncharacterized protein n=1 Tax=Trichoderma harzianum CBS 226.95 TaxID=983964 RepID=A0A2T4AQ74_TRIHA|nr:hypothetical protein M431DRAFT_516340 [Trichoderma harzianum CBS 226.95]PTB59213.1 hypothetical protein M431DRAFT_516340 [Trichoderma harzianum CBS 226.95]
MHDHDHHKEYYYELLSFLSLSFSSLNFSCSLFFFLSFVLALLSPSLHHEKKKKKTSPTSPDIMLQNCKNIPGAPQVPGSHRVSSGNTPTKVSDLLSWLRSSIAGGGSSCRTLQQPGFVRGASGQEPSYEPRDR